MKEKSKRLHFLELSAHKIKFEGVTLPLDLGRGITMRYSDEE